MCLPVWVTYFGCIGDGNAYRGTVASTNVAGNGVQTTRLAQLIADAAAGVPLYPPIDGYTQSYLVALQNSLSGPLAQMQQLAIQELISMANASVPLPQQTLAAALNLLIDQMRSASATVQAAQPTAGSQTAGIGDTPVGNPVIVAGVKDGLGNTLQYVLPSMLTFTVTADSYGRATANNEPVSILDQYSVPALNWLWPIGSGTSLNINIVNAGANNSNGNKLVNSSFETWTNANVPDNWTIVTGSPGTDVLKSATHYAGSFSCEFVGGALQTAIAQSFGTASATGIGAGGTPSTIQPNVNYGGVLFYKLSAGSPAAGVLQADLTDSAGTILKDSAGTDNTVSVDLSTVANTNWHPLKFNFRALSALTPNTPIKIRYWLSTPLTAGTNVFLDNSGFALMQQVYPGGPLFSMHSGDTLPVTGDTWTVQMANAYATSGSGLFQFWFDRTFGMRNLGLTIPNTTGGGFTVADSLVS